jgi:hypothetical protein
MANDKLVRNGVVPLRGGTTTLKGRFAGRAPKPISLAEMDDAIALEAASRHSALAKAALLSAGTQLLI